MCLSHQMSTTILAFAILGAQLRVLVILNRSEGSLSIGRTDQVD